MRRFDETWHLLLEWTMGQTPSERMAALILDEEGFESIDPAHPLGGKDGGADAMVLKAGEPWVMAVYFPRGQQSISEITEKLTSDVEKARSKTALRVGQGNRSIKLLSSDRRSMNNPSSELHQFIDRLADRCRGK